MDLKLFFEMPTSVARKQYEALRMYYIDGAPAQQVAQNFGYTCRAFTSLVTDFRRKLLMNPRDPIFFVENSPGRKVSVHTSYSDRVTIQMNRSFLKKLHQLWLRHGLLEDTANLDFTTIPYWGGRQPSGKQLVGETRKSAFQHAGSSCQRSR